MTTYVRNVKTVLKAQMPLLRDPKQLQNITSEMEPEPSPSKVEAPWHSAYPAPKNSNPSAVSRDEVRKWLDEGLIPGKDFVLVDLRRADHEVYTPNHINAFKLLISTTGRDDSGLDQPPCAKPVSKHPTTLHTLRGCWSEEGDFLLWCVHLLPSPPRRTKGL